MWGAQRFHKSKSHHFFEPLIILRSSQQELSYRLDPQETLLVKSSEPKIKKLLWKKANKNRSQGPILNETSNPQSLMFCYMHRWRQQGAKDFTVEKTDFTDGASNEFTFNFWVIFWWNQQLRCRFWLPVATTEHSEFTAALCFDRSTEFVLPCHTVVIMVISLPFKPWYCSFSHYVY